MTKYENVKTKYCIIKNKNLPILLPIFKCECSVLKSVRQMTLGSKCYYI